VTNESRSERLCGSETFVQLGIDKRARNDQIALIWDQLEVDSMAWRDPLRPHDPCPVGRPPLFLAPRTACNGVQGSTTSRAFLARRGDTGRSLRKTRHNFPSVSGRAETRGQSQTEKHSSLRVVDDQTIKILAAHAARDTQFRDRFEREARAASDAMATLTSW
jgi:hypothetical protein